MNNEIFCALLLALNFLGVAAIGYLLMLYLLRPEKGKRLLLVVPFSAEDKNITQVLYGRHIRLQLLGLRHRSAIVALDVGMTTAQRHTCEQFCRSVENMYCCTADSLPVLLERLQKDCETHGISGR